LQTSEWSANHPKHMVGVAEGSVPQPADLSNPFLRISPLNHSDGPLRAFQLGKYDYKKSINGSQREPAVFLSTG
jgi:hypothetical protein